MPVLKAGKHHVTVSSSAARDTAKGGEIVVGFENEEGFISAYLSLSDNAWTYTCEKIARLGYDIVAAGFNVAPLNGDSSPIIGVETDIVVVEEVYEGRTTYKVDRIGGGGAVKPMEAAEAESFAERTRKRLMALAGPTAKTPPATPPAAAKKKGKTPF